MVNIRMRQWVGKGVAFAYPLNPKYEGWTYRLAQSIPRWTIVRASSTSKSFATWPSEQ